MPSRAVLRKKARRDAKKMKAADPAATPTLCERVNASDAKPALLSSKTSIREQPNEMASTSLLPAFRFSSSSKSSRKRERENEEESLSVGLSRKEKRRLQLQNRLEKEIYRLEVQKKREALKAVKMVEQECRKAGDKVFTDAEWLSPSSNPEGILSSSLSSIDQAEPVRHDPCFINGTFWRNRKERRARTVFLGGLPVKNFTLPHVEKLIISTLRNDVDAASLLEELSEGSRSLSSIDSLPLRPGGKVRHMYVTLASVPLAARLISCLDGKEFNGRKLRCNFAADKNQRSEAIRKRSIKRGSLE